MPTSDDPQLSGQDHNYTPRIGGRGPRVTISPEGAYAVGNLRALIRLMEESQRQEFQRLVVVRRIQVCEQLLPHLQLFREGALEALNIAKVWLNEPTASNGRALVVPLVESEVIVFNDNTRRYRFYRSLPYDQQSAAIGLEVFEDLLIYMVNEPENTASYGKNSSFTDYRWKVETAWALLHGKPVPLYETFITDDLQGVYRSGNLFELIKRMNFDRSRKFQHAIMQQMLAYAHAYKLDHALTSQGQVLIDSIRRWVEAPTTHHAQAVRDSVNQMYEVARYTQDHDLRRDCNIADCARYILDSASQSEQAIEKRLFSDGWLYNPSVMGFSNFQRWKIEAAWAILNDQPIPPFEAL